MTFYLTGTYSLTVLHIDNDYKCELSKQIHQLQKVHVVLNYKKCCDENDFEGLSRSKHYDIVNSIKFSQQQVISGLDELVVVSVESCHSFSSL